MGLPGRRGNVLGRLGSDLGHLGDVYQKVKRVPDSSKKRVGTAWTPHGGPRASGTGTLTDTLLRAPWHGPTENPPASNAAAAAALGLAALRACLVLGPRGPRVASALAWGPCWALRAT